MTEQNTLSVLYIEDNIDDQLILRRTLKNSIKADITFDVAATAGEGMSKINANQYDLVFLDYRLPDKTGLEFLEELRAEGKTVPVIFLTGMGSEKIAVEAMRAGVEDYIIKSEIQTNEFIETIRKRLLKQPESKRSSVELSGLEEEVMKEIESLETKDIVLETDNEQLYYSGLNDFSIKHGIEVTGLILETLAGKGVLKEKAEKRLIICPICESAITEAEKSNYLCSNCRSMNIVRLNFLSHPFCGYTGDRRTFITVEGLVCPNCKMSLSHQLESSGAMDKEGYMVLGNAFECEDCETRFNRPEMSHSCTRCGEEFNYKNMGYMKLKEFTKI
jgi:DNA-binding response OmpR family regulator